MYNTTKPNNYMGECKFLFGVNESGYYEPFLGTIDLKECYIDINGTRVWEGITVTKTGILDLLYPIGSIYIGTMSVCPLQVLGVGNWQLVAADKVLQGAGTRGNVGITLNESLPNLRGKFGSWNDTVNFGISANDYGDDKGVFSNYMGRSSTRHVSESDNNSNAGKGIIFNASSYSSTYQDNAPVQPDAYLVNIWERIS